ncbi:unnamed protein product [Clonostachys rhizophaga]|uniref:Uncharacterized protein n=1 Tax=Clonostachys rhizophaga TaxID=160324 RepID=A0A9N9YQP4_9HYPO|nr:unnamed protein product [Clonostachys rhizophaga]
MDIINAFITDLNGSISPLVYKSNIMAPVAKRWLWLNSRGGKLTATPTLNPRLKLAPQQSIHKLV